MAEKKGKRAVIINNIKSGMIEQAIFILKPPAEEGAINVGSGIVAEAQEIINSYINTVEGMRHNSRHNIFSNYKVSIAIASVAAIVATALVMLLLL